MKDIILNTLTESLAVKERCIRDNVPQLSEAAERMAACLASGHKILLFGNGGSAADAQHLAAEFVNRFQVERPPLAAVALTTDTSVLTSIGNDYDFDAIFAKQIQALGRRDDIALGLSTSGNSSNVIAGMQAAQQIGLQRIGLSGRGGQLKDNSELVFCVPSDTTARIQETHITIGHILCDLVDRILFPEKFAA